MLGSCGLQSHTLPLHSHIHLAVSPSHIFCCLSGFTTDTCDLNTQAHDNKPACIRTKTNQLSPPANIQLQHFLHA